MKCDTPALASVSSRDPAPTQKPIATERTLGTRSEMTRSPESSSDRTYFCTIPPLSRPEGLAQGRNEFSVQRRLDDRVGAECLGDLSCGELRKRQQVADQ